MQVDKELLQYIAKVSRLNLSEEELSEFLPQLKEIINSFTQLKEIDTEGIPPSFQPIVVRNVLREDIAGVSLSNDEALKNTVHKKEGHFKGPKVI